MSYFPDFISVTTLTTAQLLSLHTNPVLLAPGVSGTIVDIKTILVEFTPGTHAYVVGNTDVLTLFTGSVSNNVPNADVLLNYAGGIIAASGFFNEITPQATFGFSWWVGNFTAGSQAPLSVIEGAGIYVYQFDSNAASVQDGENWTTGNGTCKITIAYSYIVA